MFVFVSDEQVAGQTHVEARAVQALEPRPNDRSVAVVAEQRLPFAQLMVTRESNTAI